MNNKISTFEAYHRIVSVFAFFWITGFLLGILFFRYCGLDFSQVFYSGFSYSASLAALLWVGFFPLFLSWLCFHFNLIYLGSLAMFAFSFLDGYFGYAVWELFGNFGWLASLILMFSSEFSALIVWFFWISSLHHRRGTFMVSCISCVGVFLVDWFYVTPFAESILF